MDDFDEDDADVSEQEEYVDVKKTLLIFVNSFAEDLKFESPVTEMKHLMDGVQLIQLLQRVIPEHFSQSKSGLTFISNAKDVKGKLHNYNLLLQCMVSALQETIEKKCDLSYIDVGAVVNANDEDDLAELMELILLVTVHCENKETVISNIMELDMGLQHHLMQIVTEAKEKQESNTAGEVARRKKAETAAKKASTASGPTPSADIPSSSSSLSIDVDKYLSNSPKNTASLSPHSVLSKQEYENEIAALKAQVKELTRTKDDLCDQMDHMKKEHSSNVDSMVVSALEKARKERDLEQDKKKTAAIASKKQVEEADSVAQELRQQLRRAQEQAENVQKRRQEDADKHKEELRRLEDEMDIWRQKSKQVPVLEATLNRYKKQLAETDELRTKLGDVQIQFESNLEKMAILEEQVKSLPAMESKMNKLKSQISDLQVQVTELSMTEEHQKDDIARLTEELSMTKKEKAFMQQQLSTTQAENVQLRSGGGGAGVAAAGSGAVSAGIAMDSVAFKEMRDALVKSQKELKEAIATGEQTNQEKEEEIQHLRAQKKTFEDKYLAERRKFNALEADNRKLSREVEDANQAAEKASASATAAIATAAAISSSSSSLSVPPAADAGASAVAEEKIQELTAQVAALKKALTAAKRQLEEKESLLLEEEVRFEEELNKEKQRTEQAVHASAAQKKAFETKLAKLQEEAPAAADGKGEVTVTAMSMADAIEKIEALTVRNKKLEAFNAKLENFVKEASKRLKQNEERLSKSIDQGVKYSEALKSLRKQVQDREVELKEREKLRMDYQNASQREQRLVASAFYEMGMEFQTALMTGRAKGTALGIRGENGGGPGAGASSSSTPGRSWLARHRARLLNSTGVNDGDKK